MKITNCSKCGLLILFIIIICTSVGCKAKNQEMLSDDAFLKLYGLGVDSEPISFEVKIPEDWSYEAGTIPEGIYWELVNVFSKDIGLDLTHWKGKTANVIIYSLDEDLSFPDFPDSKYPAMVVILRVEKQIVGAWLNSNSVTIGPSLKKRAFFEIEGRGFEEWLLAKNYFQTSVTDDDLTIKKPDEVLLTFFDAIENGDKLRAGYCLSIENQLESLMMNLDEGQLYNTSWSPENSLTESLVDCKDVIIQNFYVVEAPTVVVVDLSDREQVGIAFTAKLQWKHMQFNEQEEPLKYYAIMKKQPNGWKLSGFGAGP